MMQQQVKKLRFNKYTIYMIYILRGITTEGLYFAYNTPLNLKSDKYRTCLFFFLLKTENIYKNI